MTTLLIFIFALLPNILIVFKFGFVTALITASFTIMFLLSLFQLAGNQQIIAKLLRDKQTPK